MGWPKGKPRKPKPVETMVCQVCGEARPEERIEEVAIDVSAAFDLEELVYYCVRFCFDRPECGRRARFMARQFMVEQHKLQPANAATTGQKEAHHG